MPILTLTDLNGDAVAVNTEMIVDVKNYPEGQCWIDLVTGAYQQVQEDAEDVRQMWKDAK